MRKWAFLFSTAVAVAVIGCGGGGSGAGNGGNGGGGGTQLSSVNLPNTPGLVQVQFLTGQGRGIGDPTAIISDLTFQDTNNNIYDELLSPQQELSLLLNSYNHQIASINIPSAFNQWPAGQNSINFSAFRLKVLQLDIDNGTNSPTVYTGPSGSNAVDQSFNASYRVELGRYTAVPVFLDDAMLNYSGDPNNPIMFDANQFQSINFDPDSNLLQGFFSDYVMFDLSAMPTAQKPSLSTGAIANRVYFCGDSIAVSEAGPSGAFEVLQPATIQGGQFLPPQNIGNTTTPGTYTLLVPDPSNLNVGNAKIASLMGIWRNYTDVISNPSTFEVFVFPNTAENLQPDMVMIQRDANTGSITNMYFGGVDYQAGTFSAWPIGQVVTADASNEIDGTIGTYLDATGAAIPTVTNSTSEANVRTGTWTFTTGTLPAGWPTTGRFLVFRK